jgi:hypothetical protein
MFNFRSLAEMVGVNIDDGCATTEDGAESPGRAAEGGTSRLSQVKEDDKEDEEARAEHVEETKTVEVKPPQNEGITNDEVTAAPERQVVTPELRITPEETSPTDNSPSEAKQLGHSSITEQASQVT